MESKLKHLEFIQSVVSRMAENSFRLKRWSIVLVSAIIILVSGEESGTLALIAIAPIVVFWGLDAYFLRQERLFRALYDQVRMLDTDRIDFSMNTSHLTGKSLGWVAAFKSRTLVTFHLALIVTIILAGIFISTD